MSSDTPQKIEEKTEKLKKIDLPPFQVRLAGRCLIGRVRENNEDKMEFFLPEREDLLREKGVVLVVADGMGGHVSGQIASELAVEEFLLHYLQNDSTNTLQAMRRAIEKANAFIYAVSQGISEREGMGCTFTAGVIKGRDLFVAHIGDSRLYLLRGDELLQLTKDHTWVAEQIEKGLLSEEEGKISPFRNVLTRSLGTRGEVQVDLSQFSLQVGDVILLCTDGFYEYLEEEEIKGHLRDDLSLAIFRLTELAQERGGKDNITALAVRIIGEEGKKRGWRPFWKPRKIA